MRALIGLPPVRPPPPPPSAAAAAKPPRGLRGRPQAFFERSACSAPRNLRHRLPGWPRTSPAEKDDSSTRSRGQGTRPCLCARPVWLACAIEALLAEPPCACDEVCVRHDRDHLLLQSASVAAPIIAARVRMCTVHERSTQPPPLRAARTTAGREGWQGSRRTTRAPTVEPPI